VAALILVRVAVSPQLTQSAPTASAPPTVTLHLHYTYDNANRPTGRTCPDSTSASWGYDPGDGPTT
jgi:hypothetical protein